MPRLPPKPCRHGGCPELATAGGRCENHQGDRKQRAGEGRRGSAASRGYDRTWRRMRAAQLAKQPLCEEHERRGETVAATDVDHIIPHHGDPRLFYGADNLQSLCHPCHSRKTAREDGGFGNKQRS